MLAFSFTSKYTCMQGCVLSSIASVLNEGQIFDVEHNILHGIPCPDGV